MNERLKELAEQAGLEFDDDESLEFGKQIYYVTKEDMEKFAELIVRECVRRIEGCSIDPTQYEFDRDRAFIEGYNKAISKSASQVLLHFGEKK